MNKSKEIASITDGAIFLDSDRGKLFGLISQRFGCGSYLWKSDQYVYVSFIESLRKGNFRELVSLIRNHGLGVKIPTPLGNMQRIVRKSGYSMEKENTDLGVCEVWILEKATKS